ncbi:unnamed protein product [Amoebophrya sp. A25]|nr:unnamed protein product [Amoebophrya sp. A25]|eukprot:GSA25T00010895001.1
MMKMFSRRCSPGLLRHPPRHRLLALQPWRFFLAAVLSLVLVHLSSHAKKSTDLVDKTENPWTISVKFKQDILDFFHHELRDYYVDNSFFEPHEEREEIDRREAVLDALEAEVVATKQDVSAEEKKQTSAPLSSDDTEQSRAATPCRIGIELGAHVGLTTGFLAEHCDQVWALENSIAVLERNMENNREKGNIAYFEFHSVLDDWDTKLPKNHLLGGAVSFVLVDAAHDRASVLHDLEQASRLSRFLILDDYGAEKGVKEAVAEFVDKRKKARIVRYLGNAPPWHFEDRQVNDHEGVLLEVIHFVGVDQKRCLLASTHQSAEERASTCRVSLESTGGVILDSISTAVESVAGTRWFLYPTGVFLTGNIAVQGELNVFQNQTASLHNSEDASSTSTLEWRPALDLTGLENNFVFAGEHEGRQRRFQISFQPSFQSGMIWAVTPTGELEESRPLYVLIRDSMVRTIGEKLLSALY